MEDDSAVAMAATSRAGRESKQRGMVRVGGVGVESAGEEMV